MSRPICLRLRARRFVHGVPEAGYGAIRAFDPATGKRVWEHKMTDVTDSGLLTTASDLLFLRAIAKGHFFVLDARNGNVLWYAIPRRQVSSAPITWSLEGKSSM